MELRIDLEIGAAKIIARKNNVDIVIPLTPSIINAFMDLWTANYSQKK